MFSSHNIRISAFALCATALTACKTVERYPDATTNFSFKGKGVLVAAQDRVSGTPQVEQLYRVAAGDRAGSIHVLPLMPAPALELPVTAARLGLEKKGTEGLEPLAQLALNATLKAGNKFGVKFDYIIFVTAEKAGAVGPVTNVDHFAALYEVATKRVIAAAKITGTTTAETAAEQLPKGARAAVTLLLDGADGSGCADNTVSARTLRFIKALVREFDEALNNIIGSRFFEACQSTAESIRNRLPRNHAR